MIKIFLYGRSFYTCLHWKEVCVVTNTNIVHILFLYVQQMLVKLGLARDDIKAFKFLIQWK
jgi:hypothetical protein